MLYFVLDVTFIEIHARLEYQFDLFVIGNLWFFISGGFLVSISPSLLFQREVVSIIIMSRFWILCKSTLSNSSEISKIIGLEKLRG